MLRAVVKVLDPMGLHARPAGRIVKLVNESGLKVLIGRPDSDLVPANSPLRVMALKAKFGQELVIEVDTQDTAVFDALRNQIQEFLEEK